MTQLAPALAAYTVVPAERLTTRTPYIKIRCSHTGDQLTADDDAYRYLVMSLRMTS